MSNQTIVHSRLVTAPAAEKALATLTERAVRARRLINQGRYDGAGHNGGRYEGYLQAIALLLDQPHRTVRTAIEALAEAPE